jgi:hypothetical protein
VAEDHGAPGAEEVEIAIAVLVVEPGAFCVGEEGRLAAYGAKGADGGVDPAGEDGLGALLELVGASVGERHLPEYRSLRAWIRERYGEISGSLHSAATPLRSG